MPRSYTPAERRTRAWLVVCGAKQAFADCVDPLIEQRIDRIDERAEDRGYREAAALHRLHEQAKDEVAAAKAAERAASREDRRAARTAREKAERRLRDTERAVRRHG
ncbi:hypothetical protein NLX86_18895 [Streptomyces sp. A3M-1-3]|uniref:hypothetical protein n=1 Tax=Streptomyces sp. A3M-1-3 TaxID=2962044 RepID=UPI0020B639EE|nr:hypothetical protein [Streptomyces sp. A3M-1-3]MCP3820086.1 hypothetical protein [Streptomyces sp. A3M-1-3]